MTQLIKMLSAPSSNRSGHRPFTAAMSGSSPPGVIRILNFSMYSICSCSPIGRRHGTKDAGSVGSNPTNCTQARRSNG